ncbi:MAG: hypothetical protein ISS25_02655 [Nanoarchaeota archaeon]|nr:hypothetical protein [DPANN group archaeon]MBL7116704.1 hypothetical protein [Nanoarchaeota archaeon]
MGAIKKIYTAVIEGGKKNPNLSSDLIKEWLPAEEAFYKKCIEIGKINLSKLSDKELIALHDQFVKVTLSKNSTSSIIDGFALGTDQMIADKIRVVYDKHPVKDKMRFTEVFSTLTAPVHLSFINEAEIGLLKVALKVQKHSKDKKKLLEEHQKKFFWTRNNYVDAHVLRVKYFEKELNKILKVKKDIKEELERVENTPKENKKNKDKLMKELKLYKELKFLIKTSEDFTYWQDERKKGTFWTAHYASQLLEEIGKRVDIPAHNLKYMSPREVSKIFENKPNINILKEREKNGVLYWDKEGHEAVYGQECTNIRNAILQEKDILDIDDFRGLTASLGRVVGKVKIVKSAKEIDKVKEKDILVAVMTRPDYVPAMKRAAAVVTDEGGVTCHAAIVTRELGIPCIIGTKIATKILKDDMTVEVNANHGIVRIIRDV